MIRNLLRSHPNPLLHTAKRYTEPTPKSNWPKYLIGLSLATTGTVGFAYDATNEFEYCGAAVRFFRSLRIAATISADYLWTLHGLSEDSPVYEQTLKEVNLRGAERLLDGCLANGGLYIKIGQGVSAINHILPKEYTDTLAKLQNECLPRKEDEVRKLFRQDFDGKDPEHLFATFNYEPVAAASLAQVFRAKTHDGRDVAVKVQYIDLQKRFSGDLGTIQFLQSIIAVIHKNYNFGWILNDLRGTLEEELDFVHEGKNAERCAKELKKFDFLHVPKVHWDLTNNRVITTEWIDGYKISDLDRIRQDKLNLSDLDRKLFNIFSEQIFNTGFVHADPHPGNVLVRKTSAGNAEIVLIDHGLYEMLPPKVRYALCNFWEAIVLKDVAKMRHFAAELQVDDYDKLAEILMQRPLNMSGGPRPTRLTQEELNYMQKMAKERFDIVLTTLKQMPRQMLFVIRNINTIRAISRNHNDPLDRPVHMARYAQHCIAHFDGGFFSGINWMRRRFYFEWHLFQMQWTFWWARTYLRLLTVLHRAPSETEQLFNADFNLS